MCHVGLRAALLLCLLALAVSIHSRSARAISRTYAFEGVITVTQGNVGEAAASVGDPISGTFTYVTAADYASAPTTDIAIYSALTDLSFAFGSYVGSYGTSGAAINDIYVANDSYGEDRLQVRKRGVAGPAVLGTNPYGFTLDLTDTTGTVLSSTALPEILPPLSAFDGVNFVELTFGDPSTNQVLYGTLTELVLVPEPSSALCLLVGLAGLGWRRQSHRGCPAS